ncbi:hypothetical protein CYMTET_45954, partial [Cymbomonas tetramitiformis]
MLPDLPNLRMNICDNRCKSPPKETSKALAVLQSSRRKLPSVVVVHVAYLGVCGLPDHLENFGKMAELGVPPGRNRPYLIARAMGEEDRISMLAIQKCSTNFDE